MFLLYQCIFILAILFLVFICNFSVIFVLFFHMLYFIFYIYYNQKISKKLLQIDYIFAVDFTGKGLI